MTPPTRDAETYAIIGAAMEVHRHLGCGFLEGAGLRKAILLNFGTTSLQYRRMVLAGRDDARRAPGESAVPRSQAGA